MKVKIKTLAITMTLLYCLLFSSFAQTDNEGTKISVEIDPATFVFSGYSLHLRIQPKGYDHLLLGIGTYAMDMPSVFVDFNKNNKGLGWDVRLNHGYSFFIEHHFSKTNEKWFVGGQAGIQDYTIEKDNTDGSKKFKSALLMAYSGYTFRPFNFNLYIKPWAGIGYSSKISGSNILNGNEYDISPITMFATLHVGYTF